MPKLPGVNHPDAVRALKKVGFEVAREGKHTILTDGRRILTVPRSKPIDAFTMGGIARDAGASAEGARRGACRSVVGGKTAGVTAMR